MRWAWVVVSVVFGGVAACRETAAGPDVSEVSDGSDTIAPDTEVTGEVPEVTDDTGSDDTGSDTPDGTTWTCQLDPSDPAFVAPPYLETLGCDADFRALASEPLDASIPGARSLKTVVDRADASHLYFTNVTQYPVHYDFCQSHLSGHGLPPVGDLGTFNTTEYYTPQRRFLLGAVTYYAGPDAWVYEISPYDTASATMIASAFQAIRDHAYFGASLKFHPTSAAIEARVPQLPVDVPVLTTEQLFAGMRYQPLNLATATGRLRFVKAADIATTDLSFRDLVVLDYVPPDISVVAGTITAQLQTPLAHVNVLAQNRKTPNMALVGAWNDAALRALEGQWVELRVGAFDWDIHGISEADANAWWEAHRPTPIDIAPMDVSHTDIVTIADALPATGTLAQALQAAIPAFGGKASHYAALTRIGANVPILDGLAIPVYWYQHHLTSHGLQAELDAMLADPSFQADPAVRKARLATFQEHILAAPIDPAFIDALEAALTLVSAVPMRYRSSTNAEDLDGFTGAGLYTSMTGDPDDPDHPLDVAVKTVWASVWNDKAFEEREYRGIDHTHVGMALLVSPQHANEDANGVAVSANFFDIEGLEPAFIVNVQKGGTSVVDPPPGLVSDYFVYYWYYPGQPQFFLSHSDFVAPGTHVLTNTQAYALGRALDAIHTFFAPVYQRAGAFYGMDVEFKLDGPIGQSPGIIIKQARPHPGWGL